jgi:hypothetical protein
MACIDLEADDGKIVTIAMSDVVGENIRECPHHRK